jgi:hypothetical protein
MSSEAPHNYLSAYEGLPWVEWREDKQNFYRSIPPGGLQDSAQGFNPGNHPNRRFALKGREATR